MISRFSCVFPCFSHEKLGLQAWRERTLRFVAEQVAIHPADAVGRPAPAVECPALVPEEVLRAALIVTAVDHDVAEGELLAGSHGPEGHEVELTVDNAVRITGMIGFPGRGAARDHPAAVLEVEDVWDLTLGDFFVRHNV